MVRCSGPKHDSVMMSDVAESGSDRPQNAYDRFRDAAEWPMLALSVVFIGVLVLPATTTLSGTAADAVAAIELLIWGAFAAEVVVLFYLAPSKRQMLRDHWLDVIIVAAPFLRPLRIARLARVVRAGSALGRIILAVQRITSRKGTQAFGAVTLAVVVLGGVAAWSFERDHPDANIEGITDALWWAIVTATTVGYGDAFPVTNEGRAIAVVLMLTGIGMLGTITANVAAYFVTADEEAERERLTERLDRIEAKLDALAERR